MRHIAPILVLVAPAAALAFVITAIAVAFSKPGRTGKKFSLLCFLLLAAGIPVVQIAAFASAHLLTQIIWPLACVAQVVGIMLSGVALHVSKRPALGSAAIASAPVAAVMDLLLTYGIEATGYQIPFGS